MPGAKNPVRPRLSELLAEVSANCTNCGLCSEECGFLRLHGSPGEIALAYDPSQAGKAALSYQCSLCSLCNAVCPSGVEPESLFREMRREAVDRGQAPMRAHRGLLGYERTGSSRLFRHYSLPAGCDTVFFPGCALPGTRPETTLRLYRRLRETTPTLGIVLDCCLKPSSDLGREQYFTARFGRLKSFLLDRGVRRMLVACPNCWRVFTEHVPEVLTETVYEALAAASPPGQEATPPGNPGVGVTVHDPCVLRFARRPQDAVRRLLESRGVECQEMPHHRERTLCCGEGGNVCALAPDLGDAWGDRRAAEARGRTVVTYCAGCAGRLMSHAKAIHILDFVSDPSGSLDGTAAVSRGWKTYLNRLRLKARLRREMGTNRHGR